MAETIEGVIEKFTDYEGAPSGIILVGRDSRKEGYLNYSKPDKRAEPWDEHKVGDTVQLGINEWNGKKYIEAIKVTAKSESGAAPNLSGRQSPDDFKSLHRLEALKLAQEAVAGNITNWGSADELGAAVVALAATYAAFIEGEL